MMLECASAGAGTCTVGSGAVSFGGKIIGNADSSGALLVQAAGPISVSSVIQLNGTTLDADGGLVSLDSADAVTVTAMISLSSGAQAAGGDLSIKAKTDVTVSAELDASGGDFDGGTIDLIAGRDIVVTNDVNASALTGGGYGGEIDMAAGRDLTIAGGTASNRVIVSPTDTSPSTSSAVTEAHMITPRAAMPRSGNSRVSRPTAHRQTDSAITFLFTQTQACRSTGMSTFDPWERKAVEEISRCMPSAPSACPIFPRWSSQAGRAVPALSCCLQAAI